MPVEWSFRRRTKNRNGSGTRTFRFLPFSLYDGTPRTGSGSDRYFVVVMLIPELSVHRSSSRGRILSSRFSSKVYTCHGPRSFHPGRPRYDRRFSFWRATNSYRTSGSRATSRGYEYRSESRTHSVSSGLCRPS